MVQKAGWAAGLARCVLAAKNDVANNQQAKPSLYPHEASYAALHATGHDATIHWHWKCSEATTRMTRAVLLVFREALVHQSINKCWHSFALFQLVIQDQQ